MSREKVSPPLARCVCFMGSPFSENVTPHSTLAAQYTTTVLWVVYTTTLLQGEDDSGEDSADDEEEDGFFVPHGYLSEDEGERSDSEGGPMGAKMDKAKAKAKAWEAEFQRTCQPKKALCIGCVWAGTGEAEQQQGEDEGFLNQFSALVLTQAPVKLEPAAITPCPPENQGWSLS